MRITNSKLADTYRNNNFIFLKKDNEEEFTSITSNYLKCRDKLIDCYLQWRAADKKEPSLIRDHHVFYCGYQPSGVSKPFGRTCIGFYPPGATKESIFNTKVFAELMKISGYDKPYEIHVLKDERDHTIIIFDADDTEWLKHPIALSWLSGLIRFCAWPAFNAAQRDKRFTTVFACPSGDEGIKYLSIVHKIKEDTKWVLPLSKKETDILIADSGWSPSSWGTTLHGKHGLSSQYNFRNYTYYEQIHDLIRSA